MGVAEEEDEPAADAAAAVAPEVATPVAAAPVAAATALVAGAAATAAPVAAATTPETADEVTAAPVAAVAAVPEAAVASATAEEAAEAAEPDPAAAPDIVVFEEALGAVPAVPGGAAPIMRRFLYRGREMTAAQALRESMAQDRQSATETSRVARNRNGVKSDTAVVSSTESGAKVFAGEDPVAALVLTSEGVSIVIVVPEQFKTPAGAKSSSVSMETFEAKGTSITGVVVKLLIEETSVSWKVWLAFTYFER